MKNFALAAAFLASAFGITTAQAAFVPSQIKTVFLIPLENHDWVQGNPTAIPQQLLGNPAAPYLNSLATPGNTNAVQVSYATAYYSVNINGEHPSEPNYIWSEAGTDFGVQTDVDPSTSNGNLYSTTNHLCAQLTAAGISWKSYQEDVEYSTAATKSASGTRPSGTNIYNGSNKYSYAVKHNPMEFYTDTQNKNVTNLAQFWLDLTNNAVARYNWITPDLYNEMHSYLTSFTYHGVQYSGDQAAIAAGDNFLSIAIPKIMASAAYQSNGVIIIWTDETESTDDTNTTLPFIIISPLAKGNAYASSVALNHSSTLKMMDEIFGLSFQTNAIPTTETNAQRTGYNYVDGRSAVVNDLSDMFSSVSSCSSPAALTPTASPASTVCAGTPVTLTANATGGSTPYTYQWKTNGTAISGATGSTYSIASSTSANSLNYTVDINSSCGGTASTSPALALTVNSIPTVSVNSPTVCASDLPASITATPAGGAGPYTYAWTVPGGASNPGNAASFSATVAGTYSVVVSDANNCSSASGSGTLTVNPASVGGTATATASTLYNGGSGGSTTITLSGQTGVIVKWQSSTDGSSWSDIASTANPLPTGTLTQTNEYRAVVQSGVCGTANSDVATVNVFTLVAPTVSGQKLNATTLRLTFSGPQNQPYKVLESTTLTQPVSNWNILSSGTFGTSAVIYDDTGATDTARFYRITSP